MTIIQPTDAEDYGSAFFPLNYFQLLSDVAPVATSFLRLQQRAIGHWFQKPKSG